MCYTVNSEQLNPVNTLTPTHRQVLTFARTHGHVLAKAKTVCAPRLKSTRSCEAALKHTAHKSGTTEPLGTTTVLGQVLEWS